MRVHEGRYTGATPSNPSSAFPHGEVGEILGPIFLARYGGTGGSLTTGGSENGSSSSGLGAETGTDGQGGVEGAGDSASDRARIGWIASAEIVVDRENSLVVRRFVDEEGRHVMERWRFMEEPRR